MSTVELPQPETAADPWQLIDALLFSVSHDLRSPLLSVTLSADLLRDVSGVTEPGSAGEVAVDGLREGARDMERMLQSLTLLSRARRHVPERSRGPLGLILGGHVVVSGAPDLARHAVAMDPMTVRELLDDIAGEGPVEVQVDVEGAHVRLSAPVAVELPAFEGAPLQALASSLQAYAGGPVERLAVAQVLFERHGAALRVSDGRLVMWLPRERAS